MPEVTLEAVRHVAHLARIALSKEEEVMFETQLSDILRYMDKLNELDTSDVAPMKSVMGISNVFREDKVRASLPRDEALGNAVDHGAESFRVPVVVE